MHSKIIVLLCGILGGHALGLAVSGPAQADERENAKIALARRHFGRGVESFKAEAWSTALTEFQRSYELNAVPAVLFNIGLTQKALGFHGAAIATFKQYLAASDKTGNPVAPERRAATNAMVEEMTALLATLTLEIVPASARVVIDGKDRGRAPVGDVTLDAGAHVIEVSAPGHGSERKEITLPSGRSAISLQLEPAPVPKPDAGEGDDGQLPTSVAASEGEEQPSQDSLMAFLRTPRGEQVLVVGIVGAASLITSVVTGAMAASKREDYDQTCDDGACDDSLYDSGKNLAIATDILLGVAVVSGVAAAILVATAPPARKEPVYGFAPMLTGRGGGLTFAGAF